MIDFTGKTCPFCNTSFQPTDDVVTCSICEMPHHRECWLANGACTTFGCTGQMQQAVGSGFGSNSGARPSSDIGASSYGSVGNVCSSCGVALEPGAVFCTVCGAKVGESSNRNAADAFHSPTVSHAASPKPIPYPSHHSSSSTPSARSYSTPSSSYTTPTPLSSPSMSTYTAPTPSSPPPVSSYGDEDQCQNCGAPLEPNAMFCVNCGAKLSPKTGTFSASAAASSRVKTTVGAPRQELAPEEKEATRRNLKRAGDL